MYICLSSKKRAESQRENLLLGITKYPNIYDLVLGVRVWLNGRALSDLSDAEFHSQHQNNSSNNKLKSCLTSRQLVVTVPAVISTTQHTQMNLQDMVLGEESMP